MKHNIIGIITSALILMFCVSCAKEISPSSPVLDEGEVELSLDVFTGRMPEVIVKSQWEPNDDNEKAVYNLRVYIFSKASGALVGYGLFDRQTSVDNNNDGYDFSVDKIRTMAGDVYIYGIANATTSQYWVTDKTDILDIKDAASSNLTREQFLAATYTRQKGALNPRDNQFLMTGYVNDGNPVTITRKAGTAEAEISNPTGTDSKRLKLYKAVSKNTVEVETENGITFIPDYMALYNVPAEVALMRNLPEGDESVRPASDGFETFERIVMDENKLTFYLPENQQKTSETIRSFNDREENRYDGGTKTFVNAPSNATYMVIHGRYSSEHYTGNVNYTVHLGDFSNKISDFDVERNYNYKYTVTIKGVNNFIAESKRTADSYDHGSEGIIINSKTGQLLDVDCHYEARVMTFNKSELKDLIAKDFGYILKIKTAFCETKSLLVVSDHTVTRDGNTVSVAAGIYDAADYKSALTDMKVPTPLATVNADGSVSDPEALLLEDGGGEPDFGWVHFVQNTGTRTTYYPIISTRNNSEYLSGYSSQTHDFNEVCAYPGSDSDELMNVFQFFQKLYAATVSDDSSFFNKGSGETVYVTCFIDENYYAGKDWTEFVNKTEDRVMYCANTFDTSEDGKSSYAEAKYVISQKSIWTFYSDDVANPFGMETVSEEEVVRKKNSSFRLKSVYGSNYDPQNWNGRTSAVSHNTSSSDYRNSYKYSVCKNTGAQDVYYDPYKACMSRNRDEDGDGIIEENEIKWYLAAVDQYKGIWAGEDILPTEAKLFQPTEANWAALKDAWTGDNVDIKDSKLYPWHYFTASEQNTFWAEEGCATGSNGNAALARCIRTLENKGEGLKEADKYYSSTTSTSGSGTSAVSETVITLNLADGALRQYQGSAMQPSYERGEGHNNTLYKKFKVASSNLSTSTTSPFTRDKIINKNNGDEFIPAADDVCQTEKGEPWRVPTQKELSVMTAVISKDSLLSSDAFLWSGTSFTGLDTGKYKHDSGAQGFVFLGDGRMTISPSGTAYVRCVMDVQD